EPRGIFVVKRLHLLLQLLHLAVGGFLGLLVFFRYFGPFPIDAAEVSHEEIEIAVTIPIDDTDLGACAGFGVTAQRGVVIVIRPRSTWDKGDTFGELRLRLAADVAIPHHAAVAPTDD